MKKFTLFAAAALMAATAGAQTISQARTAQQVAQPMRQYEVKSTEKLNVRPIRVDRSLGQQLDASQVTNLQVTHPGLKPMQNIPAKLGQKMQLNQWHTIKPQGAAVSKVHKAPENIKDEYPASGFGLDENNDFTAYSEWTMYPAYGTYEDGTTAELLFDIIPDNIGLGQAIDAFADGVYVEFTTEGNTMVVAPAVVAVASDPTTGAKDYIYLADAESEDGCIRITADAEGNLTLSESAVIGYFAFSGDFDPAFKNGYHGVYDAYAGIAYGEDAIGRNEPAYEYKYRGYGKDHETSSSVEWNTYRVYSDNTDLFLDLVPNPFGGIDYVPVEYTMEKGHITIQPQLVASGQTSAGMMYIFIADQNTADGVINLNVDAKGRLSYDGAELGIIYGAFATNRFDPTYNKRSYLGYYQITKSIEYWLDGESRPDVKPEVSFQTDATLLFAGLTSDFREYTNNLAIYPVGQPIPFTNITSDAVDTWSWTAERYDDEGNLAKPLNGKNRDFSILAEANALYGNVTLVGTKGELESEPYTFGSGHAKDAFYAYAGGTMGTFSDEQGFALLSRFNLDNDGAFYSNFATYDINGEDKISNFYLMQGKPSAPLYLTNLAIPFLQFKSPNNDFYLHAKLVKVTRDANGRPTFGDIIAQADASMDGVIAYESGVSTVVFDSFYVEDEDGMTMGVDYLFVEDEFAIVIEDFNNGTFSGIMFCEAEPQASSLIYSYFELEGEEGLYSYGTAFAFKLLVAFVNGAYGYLNADSDLSKVVVPAEGGSASVTIHPMVCKNDGTTLLYLDENSEIPEWLEVGFANEDYNNEFKFDLVFTAEALPAGEAGRSASFRLFQDGAYVDVTVLQGAAAAIEAIVTDAPKAAAVNLYGMPAEAGYKGIVIRNGVKNLCK